MYLISPIQDEHLGFPVYRNYTHISTSFVLEEFLKLHDRIQYRDISMDNTAINGDRI